VTEKLSKRMIRYESRSNHSIRDSQRFIIVDTAEFADWLNMAKRLEISEADAVRRMNKAEYAKANMMLAQALGGER